MFPQKCPIAFSPNAEHQRIEPSVQSSIGIRGHGGKLLPKIGRNLIRWQWHSSESCLGAVDDVRQLRRGHPSGSGLGGARDPCPRLHPGVHVRVVERDERIEERQPLVAQDEWFGGVLIPKLDRRWVQNNFTSSG